MTTVNPLRVVVFACGELGVQVARELRALDAVAEVTVVHAPYRRARKEGIERIRHLLRYNGPVRLLLHAVARLIRPEAGHDQYRPPVEDGLAHDHGGSAVGQPLRRQPPLAHDQPQPWRCRGA